MADKGETRKRRIAIVHYHLRRGGVTRVIEAARDVMTARGDEVVIISGEPPLADARQSGVRVVPALNYRKTGSPVVAEGLAEQLKKEASEHFGGLPDVWHFHNPTLAKNVLLPSVIRELASQGERVVLQLHDFSEDGRPGNYTSQRSFFDSETSFEETLYPVAKQIHYASINQRDHDFLKAAASPVRTFTSSRTRSPTSPSRRHRQRGLFRRISFLLFIPPAGYAEKISANSSSSLSSTETASISRRACGQRILNGSVSMGSGRISRQS